MPRRSGEIAAPVQYVVGAFPDGRLRGDAPDGVAEMVEVARRLRDHLERSGQSVSALARSSGVDRTTIHAVLAGRSFVDVVTLARLERGTGAALWPGPGGT
jgi:hypothetical protein